MNPIPERKANDKLPPAVSPPKWRRQKPPRCLATQDLITQLQHETIVYYL